MIMKRLLLLFIIVANSVLLSAETICHTGGNYDDQLHGYEEHFGRYRVRVFFHIIRTADGGGYDSFPVEDIQLCIQRLNNDYQFATFADITFDYAGMDYIDNTEYYNMTSYENLYFSNLMTTNRHPDAIDVYLLPTNTSIAGIAEGIPGTALVIGGSIDFVILGSSSVLSHEMGHCLGLFHTFHGSPSESYHSCPELVGSNSTTCGDYVSDTEADPFPLYDHMIGCFWNNVDVTDANGNYYHPDPCQIMADVPANCMHTLTEVQGYRVRTHINNTPILTKRITPNVAYVQNRQFFENGEEIIMAFDSVVAGKNVTSGTIGDVIVPSGGNVSFQARDKIVLKPGFKVNYGGKFLANTNDLPAPNYIPEKHRAYPDHYIPMLENSSWTEIYHNTGDLHARAAVYKNAGDSIFEGKNYRIIKERLLFIDEPTIYPHEEILLFYEDIENKRVYIYDNFYKRDRLLYDFSIQLGDRLPCDRSTPEVYSEFILKDISTIENSGYTRHRYTFVHESDSIIWIEGIGNYCDFARPYFIKHDAKRILCVQKDNETVYDTGSFLNKTCEGVNQIYDDLTSHQAVESVNCETHSARKILRDGQLLIECDGKTYTAQGIKVE